MLTGVHLDSFCLDSKGQVNCLSAFKKAVIKFLSFLIGPLSFKNKQTFLGVQSTEKCSSHYEHTFLHCKDFIHFEQNLSHKGATKERALIRMTGLVFCLFLYDK